MSFRCGRIIPLSGLPGAEETIDKLSASGADVIKAAMDTLLSRITIRADQCHGRPCIRGMRIRVVDVLEMLSNGISEDEILQDFPDLEREDIRACLAYAVEQLGGPIMTAA